MRFSASIFILLLSTVLFSQTLAQPQVNIVEFANGIYGKTSELATNGDGRMYAATQLGYIYIISPSGIVDTVPFLDINNKVTPTSLSNTGEQGLLGLAFSPNYTTDSTFYICYTNKTGHGNSVLARYKRSANPNLADTASAEIIFALAQPYTNHNGGCLKFGSDGYLYFALGDGGDVGDPGNRAQNMNMYFGKILRIDVSQPGAYTIPSTNPFFGVMNVKNEIWASGFRNPWKFSFDRLTHDMWIGDVGQDIWEEIDFQTASSSGGENYGWRCYEGFVTYNTSVGCTGNYVSPVHAYSHATTGGCSVTGGFVYRGTTYPALYGYYFFADFCNGTIYALDPSNGNSVTVAGTFPGRAFSTFGEDDNGELYIADLINQKVYQITDTTTSISEYANELSHASVSFNQNEQSLQLSLTSKSNNQASIKLYDLKGVLIATWRLSLKSGGNTFNLPINLNSGIYLSNITLGKTSLNIKIPVIQ